MHMLSQTRGTQSFFTPLPSLHHSSCWFLSNIALISRPALSSVHFFLPLYICKYAVRKDLYSSRTCSHETALSVVPFSHFGFFNYLHHYCLINIFQILLQNNPRSTVLLAVAKANGLELEIVLEEPSKGVSAEYLKINPLGKIPTFQGEDGFILSECIAIAIYRKYLQPNTLPLYTPWCFLPSPISNSHPNYNVQT